MKQPSIPLDQALLYARDLTALHRAAGKRERQMLRYAHDLQVDHHRLRRSVLQSLLGLANALEARDPYTRGHSDRVSLWSKATATALGLAPSDCALIGQAGLLHDIGKIGIADSVLRKEGPLEPDEWALMKRHPALGEEIVAPLEFFREGARIVRHHHERWDGSGYPDGLIGTAIPIGARIVSVADVYDGLSSDRPYRKAMPLQKVLAFLAREAGRTLDPDVVAAFISI